MIRHHREPSRFNPFAVEGARAPGGGREESDPEWQPL